jgi:aminopeptidase N
MEYPGIVFDDMKDAGKDLFWISVHEVGHSWFPMIVGSNERRHAWMDEGFNTFIDVYASDTFNKGEYAPKRDPEYAEHGGNPVDEILPLLADASAPIIETPADLITEKYRHPVSYFKPALGLVLLREQILGPDRFDAAFRRYIAAWAFKHPAPADFFRLMESEAGEDLSWFWRGWFFANEKLDLAVKGAHYLDAQKQTGLAVDIAALEPLVLPAPLEITFADGTNQVVTVPVEAFYHGADAQFDVATTKKVTQVAIDPRHMLPDADRTNNVFLVK